MARTTVTLAGALALLFVGGSVAEAGARGKVYFAQGKLHDQSVKAVTKTFARQKKNVLKRDKDGHWVTTIGAFFKRKSYAGPITLWWFDAADKKSIKQRETVHVESIDSTDRHKVWVHMHDIDPDNGFNKGRKYLVWVGQLIKGREKVYAKGIVSLLADRVEGDKPKKGK